jgi:hypothetical protein
LISPRHAWRPLLTLSASSLTFSFLEQSDVPHFDLAGATLARFWKTAVFIAATAYFVVDGALSYVTRPMTAWIAKRNLFERTRLWIVSLRPYPSLALLAVPVIVLEPARPLAGYLIRSGQFGAAAITFIAAEVLKLTFVEQLFQLNRNKLLSIPAFARGYRYWLRMMDLVESMAVWKASQRLAESTAHLLRARWLQFRRVRHLQFR